MRKYLFIIAFFFSSLASAQTDSIYAEIQVTSFTYEEKTLKLKTPKVFILEKYGCTDIISLGSVNKNEIGLQFELLKSNLGNMNIIVNGKGYFLKRDGEWKMSGMTNYQGSKCKKISDKSEISKEDFGYGGITTTSVTSGKELKIDYLERYYIFN